MSTSWEYQNHQKFILNETNDMLVSSFKYVCHLPSYTWDGDLRCWNGEAGSVGSSISSDVACIPEEALQKDS